MNSSFASTGRPRTGLLAVVMFTILAGSVGTAAWLVHTRTNLPEQCGRQLIAELRQKKLSTYWSEPEVAWFVSKPGDQNRIGWMRMERKPASGGFEGNSKTFDRFLRRTTAKGEHVVEEVRTTEVWTLSDDLTKGQYRSSIAQPGRQTETMLDLSDGKLTARRATMTERAQAASAAPANYIPEGALPLAAWQASKNSQPAAMCMILDDTSIVAGQVNFTHVLMTPLGENRAQADISAAHGVIRKIYAFDSDGRLKAISSSPAGDDLVRVDIPEVIRRFPSDSVVLNFPEVKKLIRPDSGRTLHSPFDPADED